MLKIKDSIIPNNIFALVVVGVCLVGCARDINLRGNLPPAETISRLLIGEQTRQDVAEIMGTPSTTSTFANSETWFFISAKTTQFAFYPIQEVERDIYALEFDQRGILKNIKTLGLSDGEKIEIVQRETPTMGRELSLIEQLIGNLGRFDRGKPEAGP